MVAVDAPGESIVVNAVNGNRRHRTIPADGRRRRKIKVLEIPAALRGRRRFLQALESAAFARCHGVEMRVRPGGRAAIEAADEIRAASLEGLAGAHPARPGA